MTLKRSLSLLLASLMLVFALTACGRRDDTAQGNQPDNNQTESSIVGNGSDNGGNGSNSNNSNNQNGSSNSDRPNDDDSLLEDAGDAIQNGVNDVEDAVDDMTDGTAKSRARHDDNIYNQKLNSTGTLMQNGNPVTFQNLVLPGIF